MTEPSDRRRILGDSRLTSWLREYRVPAGHFDELRDGGVVRPAWDAFATHAGEWTVEHLVRAQARVDRQIHENGVTYNVYAAADGPSRPWSLDALPMLLSGADWEELARGLRQRARLLNALAADVYGGQRLVHEGVIPPALVYRHPGFLRECHGVHPPSGVFLHLVAFDVARGPDGIWRVMATRTQAPSGVGYAHENRTTIARLFPNALRALRVQSLVGFFQTLQRTLLAAAPSDGEAPHVVLLTPGPFNETYFEHVYLAKQLAIPLVEAGDLTVRHDRVFLKTVSGLHRVHVILRRTDDDFCDPLELRADSTLGIPGLVQAWRTGTVLIANALGASVVESPGLHAYLPAACVQLLGEPLEIASLTTIWCGDREALDAGEATLGRAGVVKAAFPNQAMEPVFLSDLSTAERQAWSGRIEQNPDAYVVEEYLPLSHTPVWDSRRLSSRAMMLRVFLVSDGRGQYRVMPGGLARIAGEDRHIVSNQRGGGSKDAWVLSDSPVDTPLPFDPRPVARESGFPLERFTSSRAAEHLFWLGRYAERSENCGRLLRTVLTRLTDPDDFTGPVRTVALHTCREHELLPGHVVGRENAVVERALIDGMLSVQDRLSLAFNIAQMVRVAGAVRDRLSSDNWRVLNRLFQTLAVTTADRVDLDEALEIVDQAIVSLVAVGGLEMAHMARDHGWRFLSMGRHLERLAFVVTSLERVALDGGVNDPTALEWLLDLSDSLITYRTRHRHVPEWQGVIDLLLFDARNPRSGAFQLAKLEKHVQLLPGVDHGEMTESVAGIQRLLAVCGTSPSWADPAHTPLALSDLLAASRVVAFQLSDALTLRYFSHIYERPLSTRLG
ncbi:MAG: circularly permuted type 2 ATP-grasp protein [Vicinamibacterales bacterium]